MIASLQFTVYSLRFAVVASLETRNYQLETGAAGRSTLRDKPSGSASKRGRA